MASKTSWLSIMVNPSHHTIWDTVLVPQGAEYQAVKKGLTQAHADLKVLPIPVGFSAVKHALETGKIAEQWQRRSPQGIIVLGLAGSLSPTLTKGQTVLYRSIQVIGETSLRILSCPPETLTHFSQYLGQGVVLVNALTSDRVITQASEKLFLGEKYQAQVVDMESIALLEYAHQHPMPLVILRVISDDVDQSLPDLSQIYDPQGNLQNGALAKALLSQPRRGWHLVTSSLFALKQLEDLARAIGKIIP
ncbi:MAG: hypothetical protein ACKO1W_14680 [Microcystaceae cyanobacterium]